MEGAAVLAEILLVEVVFLKESPLGALFVSEALERTFILNIVELIYASMFKVKFSQHFESHNSN